MATNMRDSYQRERRRRRRRKRRIRAALTFTTMTLLIIGVLVLGGYILRGILGERPTPRSAAASETTLQQTSEDSPKASQDNDGSAEPFVEVNNSDTPDESKTALTESTLYPDTQQDTDIAPDTEPQTRTASVDLTNLYSHYALLADASTGEILADYNGTEQIYPASMTKVMTAWLALQYISDLDASMTVPSDIFDALYAEEASMAGFLPGETATFRDLIYGVLLPSGAECCISLARWISGSEEAFVELMNQKAQELGMNSTHFCNSTGLHNDQHYTTCSDLLILLRKALESPAFREIFTSSRRSVAPTDQHPEGFTFYSTMFRSMDLIGAQVTGGEILGGKTGYTDEGGQCLISLASAGGREYILVTAKANGGPYTDPYHVLDAVNVYSQIGAAAVN